MGTNLTIVKLCKDSFCRFRIERGNDEVEIEKKNNIYGLGSH